MCVCLSVCVCGGRGTELGILNWGYPSLHSHLELIVVNLDDPQGSKYFSQVGSLIAEKEYSSQAGLVK